MDNNVRMNAMDVLAQLKERVGYPSSMDFRFFEPDQEFVEWLIEYSGDRMIFEVGCGDGHLLSLLHEHGKAKCFGCDPGFDLMAYMNIRKEGKMIQVLPHAIESPMMKGIVEKLGDNMLMVIARPCHSDFVENALALKKEGAEALYITVPENLDLYNDLGKFKKKATKINHKGSSKENEIVLSIK